MDLGGKVFEDVNLTFSLFIGSAGGVSEDYNYRFSVSAVGRFLFR
jgi:hypothetical protein